MRRARTAICFAAAIGGVLMPSVGLGQTATSALPASTAVGELGRRQDRDLDQRSSRIGRVNNRIANRVDSRLSTRLDRNYQSQAGAATAIERAARQVTDASRPMR